MKIYFKKLYIIIYYVKALKVEISFIIFFFYIYNNKVYNNIINFVTHYLYEKNTFIKINATFYSYDFSFKFV